MQLDESGDGDCGTSGKGLFVQFDSNASARLALSYNGMLVY